jgi:hypothetical protein
VTAESPINQDSPPLSSAENNDDLDELIDDPALEALREILFSQYRQQIDRLKTELDGLEERIENKDAFVAMIAPVLGDAIRRKVRDARPEMIEALYPIVGQMVVRAVSESMQDLARSIDAQMRRSFNLQTWGRRMEAGAKGVSSAEMVLRESLPFEVAEIFLIHRESGLLLWHISRDPDDDSDSDIISGMLTAIRDFTAESFGQGRDGQLDEIQYGERRILIEAAQYVYLAVVIDGIEPPGFRTEMRERVIEVSQAHETALRQYDGDPTPLEPVKEPLKSLITAGQPAQLSSGQKRFLVGVSALITLCLLASCLAGAWTWQITHPPATPVVIQPPPTSTFTATPTPTFTPTPTPTPTYTPTPTSTPTFTPTPTSTPTFTPTPVVGMMMGNVWLHADPAVDSPRLGVILAEGRPVEILAAAGDWYRVRWSPPGEAEVTGWTPAEWVGTMGAIPERIITPTGTPF